MKKGKALAEARARHAAWKAGQHSTRVAIADAVDRAVREHLQPPPHMVCFAYAEIGARVIQAVTGLDAVLQIGSLFVRIGDEGVGFDAADGGYERNEYHAWIAIPALREVIDLSARNYPSVIELVGSMQRNPGLRWPSDREVPAYVWAPTDGLPDWLRLLPDRESRLQHASQPPRTYLEPAVRAALAYAKKGFRS